MCENNQCGDTPRDGCAGMPIAMAYVPWQHFKKAYEPQRALMAGTIFPDLDKPLLGRGGDRR